jgi:hypothetical protein
MAGAGKSDAAVAFAITVLIFTFSFLRQLFGEGAGAFTGTVAAAVVIFFVALGVVKWYRGG